MSMVLNNYSDLPVHSSDFPLIGLLKHFDESIGSRGLEIGANENYCSAILQRNGHFMTGIDPNPYNPGYKPYVIAWRQIVAAIKDAGPLVLEPYDFIVSLSAIEHFGLGFYGEDIDAGADYEAMQLAYKWLKDDGRFYLTVPTGKWTVTPHWRRYDQEHFDMLIHNLFKIEAVHLLHSHDLLKEHAAAELTTDPLSMDAAWVWKGMGCNYEPLFILRKIL